MPEHFTVKFYEKHISFFLIFNWRIIALQICVRRTDVKAEAPIIWPPDVKSRLIGKDPDAGKD